MRCWMNKSDLKKLIKPVVKECIHEVLLEEGLLSNVVSEVAKGMQGSMVLESAPKTVVNTNMPSQHKIQESRAKLKQHREKLMNSINSDAYNGVNLFEGTEPLSNREAAPSGPQAGSVDLGDPSDSGVDISSLIGGASQVWKAMK